MRTISTDFLGPVEENNDKNAEEEVEEEEPEE